MTSTEAIRISEEMLPAIRANVLARKVWMSVGFLLLWGVVSLLFWLSPAAEGGDFGLPEIPGDSVLLFVLLYGIGAIGAIMVLFAAFGVITRHPRTIILAGVSVVLVGAWNIIVPFLIQATLRTEGEKVAMDYASIVIGAVQIFWGVREIRKYSLISAWLPEIATVTPEQRSRMKQHLKKFVKLKEDYFESRIQAVITDRGFMSGGRRTGYRGQIFDGRVMMISKGLGECLCIDRDSTAAGRFNDRAVVKVETDHGFRQLALGPLSVLSMKQWAGVLVTEKDIQRLVKNKKATLRIIKPFLEDEDPLLRISVLKSLKSIGRDGDATSAVAERLSDLDADVRTAALSACRDLRADDLHDRVVPLLQDDDRRVRGSAAAYVVSFPRPDLAQALRTAVQTERDKAARNQMNKAIKACEKAGANPYTHA
ncbi:MAG: HEAT repeat domain-containing protein [Phycisphaerae bacterium]|nr:HEAT repeat domain-containing protein [Phycisphaerae bacterium]